MLRPRLEIGPARPLGRCFLGRPPIGRDPLEATAASALRVSQRGLGVKLRILIGYAGVLFGFCVAATPATGQTVVGRADVATRFDRAALHRQAIEESLRPVRPGIPGERDFWNAKARSFIYAPAFDFKPVKGAVRYRHTVTAYGTQKWSFDSPSADAPLDPVWRDLPSGRLLVERVPLDARGNVHWPAEDLRPARWFVKSDGHGPAPSLRLEGARSAPMYRFTVWVAKELNFEANEPWAPLSPIWRDVPVGEAVVQVEGLDRSGRPAGKATIAESRNSSPRTFRRFHRKAVFAGPYHDAAADYRESAHRWLAWLAKTEFRNFAIGHTQGRLQGYPSKFVGAAISGMTALAGMEGDAQRKEQALRTARNAAHALIAASFPTGWGLAHFPPTYADETSTVMMQYPAYVGLAYLDLFEATGDMQMLAAAQRIADTYRRTQRADGTWPLLMDARTGERLPRSSADLLPDVVFDFLERIVNKHGLSEYRRVADATWRWILRETLTTFRFEGQFEDTGRGGDRNWNLSALPAGIIAMQLLRHRADDHSYLALAEEALRFAEDQFVIWEQAVPDDVSWQHFRRLPFTPSVLEQYAYMVPITGIAANLMAAYQAAYEATGKEIYLAKAASFANAMTVLQKRNGGEFVGTFWNPGPPGDWPNVHEYAARSLAAFGDAARWRDRRTPGQPER